MLGLSSPRFVFFCLQKGHSGLPVVVQFRGKALAATWPVISTFFISHISIKTGSPLQQFQTWEKDKGVVYLYSTTYTFY